MSGSQNLMLGGNAASSQLYVDDVFSTYLYTGNGSTQDIVNGIDLAGKGGMVWTKVRSEDGSHIIIDSARGVTKYLYTQVTDAEATSTAGTDITSFNSNGYSLGTPYNEMNDNTKSFASWTFRKAPKFFDVVTYTGNGVAGRTVAHSLGKVPGIVIVKRTNSTGGSWFVWHNGIANTEYLRLETTGAKATATGYWNSTTPTSTEFTLGSSSTNIDTATYVAYLFAHDTATDGIIQCGSFTTDGSGNATVTLGWEPQYVMLKTSSTTSNWAIADSMRKLATGASDNATLRANTSEAELLNSGTYVTSTGFVYPNGLTNTTFIYLAIRRPNKPPTSGTQVYNAVARTGTGTPTDVTGNSFPPDTVLTLRRTTSAGKFTFWDRLRGGEKALITSLTNEETTTTGALTTFYQDGVRVGTDGSGAYTGSVNANTVTYCYEYFRRAPGVFDVVCYTGNNTAGRQINHNLAAAPELMIIKPRNFAESWNIFCSYLGNGYLELSTTAAYNTFTGYWNNTAPTSTVFTVGSDAEVNSSSYNYIAYLFATKPGISYCGSVTKSGGSSLNVDCGFTTGSRFVLLKRTDSTGDWYVWDSTRGIVSGNDPYLLLNSTAAENTSTDYIDPINAGFTIVDGGLANGTYIVLSFA